MPLMDYTVEKWTLGGSVHAIARKGLKRYQLKLYNSIPYPVGEDTSQPWVKQNAARCEALLKSRQVANQILQKASGRDRCLAYAEEVFLNKTTEAPGVIEAVPFVEGARDIAFVRENADRLRSAMQSSAESLARMHACDLVHADIKPENILFVPRKLGMGIRAVLIDFDCIYRASHPPYPESVGGTEGYIAPEVIAYSNDDCEEEDGSDSVYRSKLSTARDIYSLGAVFCFMITGKVPTMDAGRVLFDRDAIKRKLSSDYICDLIEAMLAWEPEDRPTAEAVAETLKSGKLSFNIEAFEALWPEHASRYAYAPDLEKRYKRVRRKDVDGEHLYSVTYPTGDFNEYTLQMLINTGALQVRPQQTEPVEVSSEKVFTRDGIKFEEGLLWPEEDGYVIDPDQMKRWGILALYRISKDDKRGYAALKRDQGFQKITCVELTFQKILKARQAEDRE